MLERKNSVVFLGAWLDACSLWRLWLPHLNYPGSHFFIFSNRPDWNRIAGADIAVVQRCCTQSQFEFIKTCRLLDMKVVYDLDDMVFNIPAENPAANMLHSYRDGFRHCMRAVDAISVSTKTLAKAVERNVPNLINQITGKKIPIVVTENRLDARIFAEPVPGDKLKIGWAGSSSHVGDLLLIEDVIKNAAVEYPNIEFEFRGLEPPAGLKHLENISHKLWMPVSEFGVRMPLWGWSIALVPVTDHEFNDSKSCIKIMEAAYCKIPCLASWQKPYEEFCSHDKELLWLLCAGKGSWEKKLRILINEPARRKELGDRMHRVLMDYYSWNKPHAGWEKLFEAVRSL